MANQDYSVHGKAIWDWDFNIASSNVLVLKVNIKKWVILTYVIKQRKCLTQGRFMYKHIIQSIKQGTWRHVGHKQGITYNSIWGKEVLLTVILYAKFINQKRLETSLMTV